MKRSALITFLTIILSPLTTAGPIEGLQQLTEGLRETIKILIRFISEAVLEINAFDEYLFAKLILFTIILLVTYTVIKQNHIFGGTKNKAIQWIISIAVSLLAIRYLPNTFVEAILLQYGALAVGLTVFLPLVIYFFFLHQSGIGPFGRRAGWLVFAASFFALWSFRHEDLGEANWIYWIAIGFVLISMIFDKKIHEYFGLSSIRKIRKGISEDNRLEALRRLKTLEEDFTNGYYVGKQREYDKKKEHLKEVIRKNT